MLTNYKTNNETASHDVKRPGGGEHGNHYPDNPGKPNLGNHLVTIFINGRPHEIKEGTELSFADIVKLAFGAYENNSTILYTVSFSNGHHSNQQGVLVSGQSLKVKGGLIINVGRSSRS